jgi:hypothetical protein
MEADAAKTKEKEQAEISKKEREVAELDTQIAAMKSRLGTSAAGAQDSLQGMLAMVEQKEKEAIRLEELRKQREEEEQKRQAEIAKLKAEAEARRVKAIEQDIATYQKIIASPYGKDMAATAWQSLVSKYPEAKNVVAGDINALKRALNLLRFIANNNGTVSDTKTNLMWAAKDNGSDINWANAKNYCKNYRGGGYSDWRMPTQDELAGLYDKGIGYKPVCAASGDNDTVKLTNLITLSCWGGWASETRGSKAAGFIFYEGDRGWNLQSHVNGTRALPVRSGK